MWTYLWKLLCLLWSGDHYWDRYRDSSEELQVPVQIFVGTPLETIVENPLLRYLYIKRTRNHLWSSLVRICGWLFYSSPNVISPKSDVVEKKVQELSLVTGYRGYTGNRGIRWTNVAFGKKAFGEYWRIIIYFLLCTEITLWCRCDI